MEGKEENEVVLDLSGKRIKQLDRAPVNQLFATALVLDNNNLQNLTNLDSYGELERLSVANNQIVRMYWFARMYSIRILNLPNNNIVQIEGLRELHHLIHLNLSGNNLKNIDGLSHSHKLEHLNVSGNYINQITDLTMLKNLKELFLHRNRISSLHRGNKYLPSALFILTLSDNCISDVNDFCNISHLNNLEQFTCLNNPCLDPIQQVDENGIVVGPPLGFDYRPYIINWCLNLKVLDGYKITPKESLKGEWLYSQGKGRGFQEGEHEALVHYLSGICLAGGGWGGADLPDDDVKLGKILQLAKQHQQDLRHSSVNGHDNSDSSSGCGSRGSSHHDSPASLRRDISRARSPKKSAGCHKPLKKPIERPRRSLSHSTQLQAHMRSSGAHEIQNLNAHSYHVELSSTLYGGELKTPDAPGLMTQSMDPSLLAQLSSGECHSIECFDQMSQSLGPELMTRDLKAELPSSVSGSALDAHQYSTRDDIMIRSLEPEHLRQTLRTPSVKYNDHPQRPMRLFSLQENSRMDQSHVDRGNQLAGSSEFVPVPDSLVSPECDSRVHVSSSVQSHSSGSQGSVGRMGNKMRTDSSLTKSSTNISRSSGSQSSPKSNRSSSCQRNRNVPMKAAPSELSSRGPQRSQPRSQPSLNPQLGTNTATPKTRHSPKPAPRASRMNSTSSHILKSASTELASSVDSKADSDVDSEDTDSEMSVSKLQTIKSIAAERKGNNREGKVANASHSSTNAKVTTRFPTNNHVTSKVSSYNPDKYRGSSDLRNGKILKMSNSGSNIESSASRRDRNPPDRTNMSRREAAVLIQCHWRGFYARKNNPITRRMRQDDRQSRAEDHITYLTEKLRATEASLLRERKLRHLQLDAIRTLWREIQKLHAGRKEGINTPTTPMTPITPLTPLENCKRMSKSKDKSEENSAELRDLCSSLQTQVSNLQESLSMVTQVMNSFCNLPGSQLLLMSQSSGSGMEKSVTEEDGYDGSLQKSVASFTNSIAALTFSIAKDATGDGEGKTNSKPSNTADLLQTATSIVEKNTINHNPCGVARNGNGSVLTAPELNTSVTSLGSTDLNSTGQDVSTLSNDSNATTDATHQPDTADVSDSSQSSLSINLSCDNGTGSAQRASAPTRPSTLPVARPHTPRKSS